MHLRHRGEPADVDAEVRNLLIRGGLRPLDKDDRGHKEDEERHGERTHAGGANLVPTRTAASKQQGAEVRGQVPAVGAAWPARGAAEDEDWHGSRECTVWSLRHALRIVARSWRKAPGHRPQNRLFRPRGRGPGQGKPAALTSSIVVHAAAGATSRRENMAGALLTKGPSLVWYSLPRPGFCGPLLSSVRAACDLVC